MSTVADYEHPVPLFDQTNWFLRAEHSFRSSFTSAVTPGSTELEGFNVVNFRAGLRARRYEVTAFVENAFDALYATGTTGTGPDSGLDVGPTRRFGLIATVAF
ncbi:MAG: hypothetical protein AAF899_12160 [Pseudomonadota bacterium]